MIKDWKNKKVAILGFGVEGMSSARFLAKMGAEVWILDAKKREDFEQEFLAEGEKTAKGFVFGEDYLTGLLKFEILVRSPGINRNLPGLQEAERKGVKITSQTNIFFELCPGMIIGVTGTKGKGTTATLIYKMLKKSGRDVYLGGNIGTPPLDFLDKLSEQSVAVLELSSFQLADLSIENADKTEAGVKAHSAKAFRDTSWGKPHIAVMLMITPEHLNYHKDMQEYVEAKRNILRYQTSSDYAVINRDYVPSNESDIVTTGQVFYISRERATSEQGAYVNDGAIWMRMKGAEWKIIDSDKIALVGKHNWENAAASAVAATLGGAEKADIVEVLKTFKGLEHRLELVREVGGVRYYDDSFSTTPETAIAAIESFAEPEILILGGSSKNSDFSELGEVIGKAENIRAIIGVGEEWEKIKEKILKQVQDDKKPLLIEGAKDMKTVVAAASKIAAQGDVVLLSPACASFGMFKNYKERGDEFKKEVNKLH